MDFFQKQDLARRRTSRLVVYFILAVISIIVTIYFSAVAVVVVAGEPNPMGHRLEAHHFWDPVLFGGVTAGVLVVVVLASLYKIAELSAGGEVVARSLGGRRLDPNSTDLIERRLLNVVEEMAIASGVATPPVFLLDREPGINAFAAGFTPNSAVIGVTRGTVEYMDRDKLQGVIAHEFSHILNGDMRLDIRLMGILHGILVLAVIGYYILRISGDSSSRDDDKDKKDGRAMFMLFGLALMAIGYIGLFFGRLIKASVSRQREFLADASAVQFTRNPDGIAGALKTIGGLQQGSIVVSPAAEEASHMFFADGIKRLSELLATHPPLDVRIREIDPNFDGVFPTPSPVNQFISEEDIAPHLESAPAGAATRRPFDAAKSVANIGVLRPETVVRASGLLAALPAVLLESARQPFQARAVIFALLLSRDEAVRAVQLNFLRGRIDAETERILEQLVGVLDALPEDQRLPLADLSMPALAQMSPEQYEPFRKAVAELISADNRTDLFEYALQRMLLRRCDARFRPAKSAPVRYSTMQQAIGFANVLVSTTAYAGHDDDKEINAAYAAGLAKLSWDSPLPMLGRDKSTLRDVDRALSELAKAAPEVKRKVLEAVAATIAADGTTTVREAELLRAIADSLDCPMPPHLPAVA